jgi:hypothetical protein
MAVNGVARAVALAGLLVSGLISRAANASCFDGVRDGPESDVDCGGDCPPCDRGQFCRIPRDCYSGRCAQAICEERSHERSEEIPPGYHVETSVADSAAAARTIGFISLGVGYGAAYVTALSLPGNASWMYLPVFGPWIEVADSSQKMRGLIAVDGFFQTVGAGLVLGGIAMSGRQLVRDDALFANVFFVPAPIGHDGFALFANGRF